MLDVQADLFSNLETRLVVPLRPVVRNGIRLTSRLNPVFRIDKADYYMDTAEMAAIPVSLLKSRKENLEDRRQDIIDALDFIMQGF